MSLRREIHSAFDGVAPPAFGLAERVVDTALKENAIRRRKERMLVRLRAPISLVAVFLVIALVAAVFVGGRLIHDWNALHQVPAGTSYPIQVAQLEARPLHLPSLQKIQDCKSGPYNRDHDFGSGPVYLTGAAAGGSAWGSYFNGHVYADTDVSGPILVRAQDLFTKQRLIFAGDYAAGTPLGKDTFDGGTVQQYDEILVNTKNASSTASTAAGHKYVWPFVLGMPKGGSGSNGWQIDGISFTETFLLC